MKTYFVTLNYDYERILQMVERETTEVGKRQIDKDGNSLFESLVLDEGYRDLTLAYMRRASAVITDTLSAYIRHTPHSMYDQEVLDGANLNLCLEFPVTFPETNVRTIDTAIYDYMVSYMCREWFMNKLPEVAEMYKIKEDTAIGDIRHRLAMRKHVIQRPYKII